MALQGLQLGNGKGKTWLEKLPAWVCPDLKKKSGEKGSNMALMIAAKNL